MFFLSLFLSSFLPFSLLFSLRKGVQRKGYVRGGGDGGAGQDNLIYNHFKAGEIRGWLLA